MASNALKTSLMTIVGCVVALFVVLSIISSNPSKPE